MNNVIAAAEAFVALNEKLYNESMEKRLGSPEYPNFQTVKLTIKKGSKNLKVIREDIHHGKPTGSRSVHAFIDIATGAILKPASWAAPAKGSRGNVLNEDGGLSALDPHGFIKYLK